MKLNHPLVALAGAVLIAIPAIVGVIGNASTVVNMLDWLSPQARTFLIAESTWRYAAALAFVWFALELSRDAGLGSKALIDAKLANEKAWTFEPEFRQAIKDFKTDREDLRAQRHKLEIQHSEISQAIESLRVELQGGITSMQKEVESARNYWGQEFGESRAMEQRRFDAKFDPFQASIWMEIDKVRREHLRLETELGSRIVVLERPPRSEG